MPSDSEFKKIEKRLDAIAPAPAGESINLDEAMPVMMKALGDFPDAAAAVRAAALNPGELVSSVLDALRQYPEAYAAVGKALEEDEEAEAIPRMTPERREVYFWYKAKKERGEAYLAESVRILKANGYHSPTPANPATRENSPLLFKFFDEHAEREKSERDNAPASVKAIEAERERSLKADGVYRDAPQSCNMVKHPEEPVFGI